MNDKRVTNFIYKIDTNIYQRYNLKPIGNFVSKLLKNNLSSQFSAAQSFINLIDYKLTGPSLYFKDLNSIGKDSNVYEFINTRTLPIVSLAQSILRDTISNTYPMHKLIQSTIMLRNNFKYGIFG